MPKIVITIDSSSEAEVKIENRNAIDVDIEIEYKGKKHRFKTQKDVPLRRMLLDFCDRHGLVYSTTIFSIDCRCHNRVQIKDSQTADELGIADGHTIYAAATGEKITSRIDVHIQHFGNMKKYRFNTDRDVPLRRILLDFSDRVDLPYRRVAFYFEGRLIPDSKTPDDLGMADDDIIDAMCRIP